MAGPAQVRTLRRTKRFSNIRVDTSVGPQTNNLDGAKTSTQQPASRVQQGSSRHQYQLSSSKIPPTQHRQQAYATDGVRRSLSAGSLAAFSRTFVSVPDTPYHHRRSKSSGMSIGSCFRAKKRPTISEPENPRILSSVAGPQSMNQPLIRYATLTHEGHEFPPASPSRPSSRHDVETPDPLRCHPGNQPLASPASYISTDQHLTSATRRKRANKQQQQLITDLRKQLEAAKLERLQRGPEMEQLRRELEWQRTQTEHYKKATAEAMKQTLTPFLAKDDLNHRELVASLLKRIKMLEEQYNFANNEKIREHNIANQERQNSEVQGHFIKAMKREKERNAIELEQVKTELMAYKARFEASEAVVQSQAPQHRSPLGEQIVEPKMVVESRVSGVPSRTFSKFMRSIGHSEPMVLSFSKHNIIPALSVGPCPPSSIPGPEHSSENLSLEAAQPTEVQVKRSSQLRSFKLPEIVKQREAQALVEQSGNNYVSSSKLSSRSADELFLDPTPFLPVKSPLRALSSSDETLQHQAPPPQGKNQPARHINEDISPKTSYPEPFPKYKAYRPASAATAIYHPYRPESKKDKKSSGFVSYKAYSPDFATYHPYRPEKDEGSYGLLPGAVSYDDLEQSYADMEDEYGTSFDKEKLMDYSEHIQYGWGTVRKLSH